MEQCPHSLCMLWLCMMGLVVFHVGSVTRPDQCHPSIVASDHALIPASPHHKHSSWLQIHTQLHKHSFKGGFNSIHESTIGQGWSLVNSTQWIQFGASVAAGGLLCEEGKEENGHTSARFSSSAIPLATKTRVGFWMSLGVGLSSVLLHCWCLMSLSLSLDAVIVCIR